VGCGWVNRYTRARAGADQAGIVEAAAGMARMPDWPALVEQDPDKRYAGAAQAIADRMRRGVAVEDLGSLAPCSVGD